MSEAIPPNNFHVPTPGELAPHFPGFEVQELISRSGTEAVYRANQVSLGRMVAIKILPWDVKDDWRMRAEFEAEARAMARLRHPNLIAVYDFGEVSGMLFVVRELFVAKSLFHYSNGRAIDPMEAVNLVGGICKGLAHAHQNGILHGNLKPNNILLSAQKELKIKNFRPFDPLPGGDRAGSDAQLVPGYRAPELLNAPHLVDLRADVYAVGVVLHELLTGKMPAEDPRLPSEISGCDQRFDEIIRRATDPFPAYRYAGLEELDADLHALVAPVPAPRQSPQTQAIVVVAPSKRLMTRPPAPYRAPVVQVKRKSRISSLISTLLIASLIAGLIYYLKFSAPGSAGRQGGNKATEPQISGIVDLAAKSNTTETPMTGSELLLLLNRAIAENPSGPRQTYYKALFLAKSSDGTDVDGEIARFATSREMPPDVREVLIRDVLRMRKNPSIVPVLIDYAHSTADPRGAVASIEAIRFMADETHFHRLISLIHAKSNPEVHKAVEDTVAEIIRKSKQRVQIEASLATSYRNLKNPEERYPLLRLMGHCGGVKPLEVVREALQSNESELKSAALSSLGVWGDDAGFPILLELLANPKNEPFRVQTFEVALKFVIARARTSANPQHWTELKKQARTRDEQVSMIRAMHPLDHDWALQMLEEYTRSTDARVADLSKTAILQIKERGGIANKAAPSKATTAQAGGVVLNAEDSALVMRMPPPGVPRDATYFRGKWYYAYQEVLPWTVANERCLNLGGQLAVIPDQSTQEFVKKLVQGEGCWLGATDRVQEGKWIWSDGSQMTYNNFASGCPDNLEGNQHYLNMWGDGRWNDLKNEGFKSDIARYLCEWPDKPEGLAGVEGPSAVSRISLDRKLRINARSALLTPENEVFLRGLGVKVESNDRAFPVYSVLWGEQDVFVVHPNNRTTPGIVDFTDITRNSAGSLIVKLRDHPGGDCKYEVVKSSVVISSENLNSDQWRTIEIPFDNESVSLAIHPTGWMNEFVFLTYHLKSSVGLQEDKSLVNDTEKFWKTKAMSDFPDLKVPDSELTRRMKDLRAQKEAKFPDFFGNPQWPYLLADEANRGLQESKKGIDRPEISTVKSAAAISVREFLDLRKKGSNLTQDEVAVLEKKLLDEPNDTNVRTQLIGFYMRIRSAEAVAIVTSHYLWFIRNFPESSIYGYGINHALVHGSAAGEAKALWLDHLARQPKNLNILNEAANFFKLKEPKLAEDCLVKAAESDSQNFSRWDALGEFHLYHSRDDQSIRRAKSLANYEKAETVDSAPKPVGWRNGVMAKIAYNIGDFEKAEHYAISSLEFAKSFPDHYYSIEITHYGNTILGLGAMRQGNVSQAKDFLIKSSQVSAAPSNISRNGPCMLLAKLLLERNEKDVVLEFFSLCGGFWKTGDWLEKASKQVTAGEMPDFGRLISM